MKPHARTIRASEFKARCLQLMEDVARTGEGIVITKRGRPVSRLVPYREKPASLFGLHGEGVVIHGDLVAPVGVEWEASR